MVRDVYWCDGCKVKFPIKRLKRCGACRVPIYCSAACQAADWKGGHKQLCQEVTVQKELLKGWAHTWDHILRWTTILALDLANRPGDNRNHCLEIKLRKTGSNDVCHAYEVLDGRVRAMNVDDASFYERNSHVPKEDLKNRLYLTLPVDGERGQLIDAISVAWTPTNLTHDTPERSKAKAKHCVEVLKSVVANSKPRNAIRDATLTMETALMGLGLSSICFPSA